MCLHFFNKELKNHGCKCHFQIGNLPAFIFHMYLVCSGIVNFIFGVQFLSSKKILYWLILALFYYSFIQQIQSLITVMFMNPGYVEQEKYKKENEEIQKEVKQKIEQIQDTDRQRQELEIQQCKQVYDITMEHCQVMQSSPQSVFDQRQKLVKILQQFDPKRAAIVDANFKNQQELYEKTGDIKYVVDPTMYGRYFKTTYDKLSEEEIIKTTKFFNYCSKCRYYKPSRAHHCRQCNKCIEVQDHHCPFIMNCVGQFNFPYFYKFTLYSAISAFISAFVLMYGKITHLSIQVQVHRQVITLFQIMLFVLQIVFAIVGTLFPLFMFISTSYGIAQNLTTIEQKLMQQGLLQKIQDSNQGIRAKLGKSWFIFMILPIQAKI